MSGGSTGEAPDSWPLFYRMAPSIRLTLLALYLALAAPLPALAPGGLRTPLVAAVVLGWLLVLAASSERVELDADGIRVGHPAWCAWLLRRRWSLPWQAVAGLTPVATSQGGRVFYVRAAGPEPGGGGGAYLLPQRVARFEEFLRNFTAATGVETGQVGRLTPPWTYRLLALLSGLLLAGEAGVALRLATTAIRGGPAAN